MRAVKNEEYGNPQVLHLCEIERPPIGPKDILVRVHATTVTQGDRRLRAADYPGISALFGRLFSGLRRPRHQVGGTNFAGRVVQVGVEVTRFKVGDDVMGSAMHGANAEYLSIGEQEAVATLPQTIGYAEAAALPYGGVTALVFLRDYAQVKPGQRVLIVGASGGVGRLAVGVARSLGAHVTGVCGTDADLVRRLGADDVIDYRNEDFSERGDKWDVILDTTQGNHFRAHRRALTENGLYLTLYMSARVVFEMLLTKLRGGQRALCGVALGNAQLMTDLARLADEDMLRDPIAARFSLDRASEAHAFLEDEAPHGSIVLDVAERGTPALRAA